VIGRTTDRCPDLYAILGVPPHAATLAIAAAYRRRTLAVDPGGAEESSLAIALALAHYILEDPARRATYDRRRRSAARRERLEAVIKGMAAAPRAGLRHLLFAVSFLGIMLCEALFLVGFLAGTDLISIRDLLRSAHLTGLLGLVEDLHRELDRTDIVFLELAAALTAGGLMPLLAALVRHFRP
jgi:hypothetical protein